MDRLPIRKLFDSPEQYFGTEVTVCGWLRNNRISKAFGFLNLSDGSCFQTLQVVVTDALSNFAEVGNVFELLDVRHVGERMLDQYSTANFPKVLQSLYPHIEPEEDIWHTPKEESEEMSDEDQAPQMTM